MSNGQAVKQLKSQAVILFLGLTMVMIASYITLPLLAQVLPELAPWPTVQSAVLNLAFFIVAYCLIACVLLAIQVLITAYAYVKAIDSNRRMICVGGDT